ncbi:RFA2B-like protein [Mya arenaria]|uniref:RFA2B-like protein n=1 Tax=Mya arenaria TaxID=6604 RepID=A0ABY7FQH1_MYAAR|nr:RFA2B-like protein [Mya arenaria]
MWNNQEGFQAQGGFSSPGGFGTPQADEKRSRQRAQTIVPVTAAEIINSTQQDDKFYSGEIEIYQVSMIGLVRAVKESATRIDYEIDDLTGPPLEVKQSFGGKKSITASKITPVTDMNELTYHILEVVHSHITANAGQTGGGDMGGAVQGMTSMDQGGAGFSDDMVSGLTSIQNQVRMAIKSDGSAEGASVDMVSRQMKGLPEKAIRDAIEFLSSEGHIYSTIDDDHYKATDS